ncbi:hypothetical protein M422DRAFT_250608 [Sphaerobolus stellatus SS14]|uniref:Uncharacterized protein n=1 Tax=Sphaerobolus stellatus (strain SS14) TaxID=990650 RepID=A0A0C9USK6_SPHS4|nr:hypothetical protein M422DRAFT_250608 [Sphaerobolus stellatus SS14]
MLEQVSDVITAAHRALFHLPSTAVLTASARPFSETASLLLSIFTQYQSTFYPLGNIDKAYCPKNSRTELYCPSFASALKIAPSLPAQPQREMRSLFNQEFDYKIPISQPSLFTLLALRHCPQLSLLILPYSGTALKERTL